MNTNSNTYTVIYTTLVCVLVAAILAFVSQLLKPKQEANEKAETISQILTAAGFDEKAHWQEIGNAATIDFYKENLAEAYTVSAQGAQVKSLDKAKADIYSVSDLKVQNRAIKAGKDYEIPVYTFTNGVTVIPVYGAGLWGPVWGYLSFDASLDNIEGAYFDHESETPGLGGKIKDDPAFRAQFKGKNVNFADAKAFEIVKGGAPADKRNAIDAITGATMTSKGLDEAINNWLGAFKAYLQGRIQAKAAEAEAAAAAAAEAEAAATETQTAE
jgi:Na+-transporting NADH:ubiquinone oxidoreductase subunit C